MKKRGIALILLLTMGCLSGCHPVQYRDDISCAAITDRLTDALAVSGGYESFGDEHLRFYFEDTNAYDERSLVYSALSEDINEIGVFRADDDEDIEKLRELCQRYIDALAEDQRAFVASYAPEEVTKLDHAEVRVYGDYVIYTVLSPKDRDTAWETLEAMLKE